MLELNCFTFKLKLQLDCLVSLFAVLHVLYKTLCLLTLFLEELSTQFFSVLTRPILVSICNKSFKQIYFFLCLRFKPLWHTFWFTDFWTNEEFSNYFSSCFCLFLSLNLKKYSQIRKFLKYSFFQQIRFDVWEQKVFFSLVFV